MFLLKKIRCDVPEPPLRRGDAVYLVGLSRSLQATSRKSVVTNPHASLNIGSADCPRYRATNMEVIELDTGNLSLYCLTFILIVLLAIFFFPPVSFFVSSPVKPT